MCSILSIFTCRENVSFCRNSYTCDHINWNSYVWKMWAYWPQCNCVGSVSLPTVVICVESVCKMKLKRLPSRISMRHTRVAGPTQMTKFLYPITYILLLFSKKIPCLFRYEYNDALRRNVYPTCIIYAFLTNWGREKMALISQTIFSNAFSWMKTWISIKISLNVVPKGVELTIS